MKKSKILILCTLVACLAVLLSSCGTLGILKYANDEYSAPVAVNTATKLPSLSGILVDSREELVLLQKTEYITDSVTGYDKSTLTVFNLAKGEAVLTVSEPNEKTDYSISLDSIGTTPYFIVTERVDGEVSSQKVYDASGAMIANTSKDAEYIKMLDDFKFGYAVYTLDSDNKIVQLGTLDELVDMSVADTFSRDYAYIMSENGISVMTTLGEYLSVYTYKSQYTKISEGILANGNVYVQYFDILPDDAKKFDLYTDGSKANLITEIFNVKSGSVKNANVDFICTLGFGGEDMDTYSTYEDGFKLNTAHIQSIVDNRIEERSVLAVIDNKLNIKAVGDDTVPCFDDWDCISKGRFVVEDDFGTYHFISNGKIIKSVDSDMVDYNSSYVFSESTIYDLDFSVVLDLTEKDYEIEDSGKTSVLLSREVGDAVEYSVFTNAGEIKTLIASDSTARFVALAMDLYCVRTDEGTYRYYNEAGELVGAYESPMVSVAYDYTSGNRLVMIEDSYYIISAK